MERRRRSKFGFPAEALCHQVDCWQPFGRIFTYGNDRPFPRRVVSGFCQRAKLGNRLRVSGVFRFYPRNGFIDLGLRICALALKLGALCLCLGFSAPAIQFSQRNATALKFDPGLVDGTLCGQDITDRSVEEDSGAPLLRCGESGFQCSNVNFGHTVRERGDVVAATKQLPDFLQQVSSLRIL